MAHRLKHRREAQIKRAGAGRKIKSDFCLAIGSDPKHPTYTRRTTDEYKAAQKEFKRRAKLTEVSDESNSG